MNSMSITQVLQLAMALALLVSAAGFIRLVYFVSLGYGLSITVIASAALVLHGSAAPVTGVVHAAALLVYGVRLTGYLLWRERLPSYRKELTEIQARAVGVGRVKQLAIWVGVSLLYVLMALPAVLHVRLSTVAWPDAAVGGLVVAFFGLGLESLADRQKGAFKRLHPDRFCDWKLYRVVRCPNYLGEIVFWVGSFIAGLSAYDGWWAWLGAAVGLVCIVLIMIGSTKRLERKQEERYGKDPAYQQYIASTPVLFPWVPIYSLKNVRVYLE